MRDLWRLLRLGRPYAGWGLLGAGLALSTLIANLTLMAVAGWLVAAMALAGAAGVSMNYFTPAAVIRASAIARVLGRYAERLVTHEATLRLLAGLRVWLYQGLEPLAPARLGDFRSGDVLSRLHADVETLDNFYLRVLVPAVTGLVGGGACVVFLWHYDGGLALVLLGSVLLAGLVLPSLLARLGDGSGWRSVELQAALRAAAVDGVQGLAELQVYGAAGRQAAEVERIGTALAREQRTMAALDGIGQGALALAANLALWLSLWIAIPLVRGGVIAPPELAMLALFTLAAFEAVMPLPGALRALGATRAAARRVFELLDAQPEVSEPPHPLPLPQGFDIRFEGVGLTYPGADRAALRGIDLHLPEGGRLAVVGPSGAGKTSLVHLLLGFRALQAGSITLGGVDIRHLRGEDLRRRIAVVSQQTHLFTGTVRENLLLASPEAPQGRIEAACRAAQIHDFIAAQPAGYDTEVGEAGVALSGGQARRLAVARALLKDAPVLVLDEPTEGLDGPTARALMATLVGLMAGRSVLLITHRTEGLDAMDQVLVLEQGSVRAPGVGEGPSR